MFISLDIPWKVSANKIYESRHWRERKEMKDNYKEYYVPKFRMLDLITIYPVKMRWDFEFKSHALDVLNCAYMAKMIEDCLVEAGVLIDDRVKYVKSSELLSRKGKKNAFNLTISRFS